jgi:hypothetical protein
MSGRSSVQSRERKRPGFSAEDWFREIGRSRHEKDRASFLRRLEELTSEPQKHSIDTARALGCSHLQCAQAKPALYMATSLPQARSASGLL